MNKKLIVIIIIGIVSIIGMTSAAIILLLKHNKNRPNQGAEVVYSNQEIIPQTVINEKTDISTDVQESTTENNIQGAIRYNTSTEAYNSFINELTIKGYRFYSIYDFNSDGKDELFTCTERDGLLDFVFYAFDESSGTVIELNGLKGIEDSEASYDSSSFAFFDDGSVSYDNYTYNFSSEKNYFNDIGLMSLLNNDKNNSIEDYRFHGYCVEGDTEVGIHLYIIGAGEKVESGELSESQAVGLSSNVSHTYIFPKLIYYTDTINESGNAPQNEISEEDIYEEVINDYRNVILNNDYSILEKYPINYFDEVKNNYGYIIMDIDENGTKELLLGDMRLTDYGYISQMFTIDGEQPVMIFDGWSRSSWCLLSDNTLLYSGSGGAYYTNTTHYDYSNGKLLIMESYFTDGPDAAYRSFDSDSYNPDEYEQINVEEMKSAYDELASQEIKLDYVPIME